MNTSHWPREAQDAARNGFTVVELLHQVVGRASTLMAGERVFDSDEAVRIAEDAEAALRALLRVAINQQGIDAIAEIADYELELLITEAPAWGRKVGEPS